MPAPYLRPMRQHARASLHLMSLRLSCWVFWRSRLKVVVLILCSTSNHRNDVVRICLASRLLRLPDTADPHHHQSCISDTSAAADRKTMKQVKSKKQALTLIQQRPTTSTLRVTKASYLRAGAAGEDMIEHSRSSAVPRHHRLPRPRQSR